MSTYCRICAREGTLGISECGCAAGTVDPLAYNRASSAEVPETRVNSPNLPYMLNNAKYARTLYQEQ